MPLALGYRRRPEKPPQAGEPAEGPYLDEIDPDQAVIVQAAFKQIANGDPCWLVAQCLTNERLPKCPNAIRDEWDEGDVIHLIRRTIYRGLDRHRVTITARKRRSGKKRSVRNVPEEIWERDMPHLRIVPDWLWYKANDTIDARRASRTASLDSKHSLAGLPRDSRGPLSQIFFCACGGKMHHDRNHRYRCSRAKKGKCWIKATTDQALTLDRLSSAIINEIVKHEEIIDVLVQFCQDLRNDPQPLGDELARLQTQKNELLLKCQRLALSIEARDNPSETIVALIAAREQDLAKVRVRIQELEAQAAAPKSPLTRAMIEQHILRVACQVMDMDREAAVAIQRLLIDRIRAVPYFLVGTNKVVLRAEFAIQLAGIIPDQLLCALRDNGYQPDCKLLEPIDLVVDLFPTLPVPTYAVKAFELMRSMTLARIAKELGESKRNAHRAAQLGKRMHELKVTDPFVRLTEPPEKLPARWRFNRTAPPKDTWSDGKNGQPPVT